MRLLLINPRFPESFWSSKWALAEVLPNKRTMNPPLGLATLAAWLLTVGSGAFMLAGWIRHERSSHFGAGPDHAADMRLAETLSAWWERRRTEAT